MKYFIKVAGPIVLFLAFVSFFLLYTLEFLIFRHVSVYELFVISFSLALILGIIYTKLVIDKYNSVNAYIEFRKIIKENTATIIIEKYNKEKVYDLFLSNLSNMSNCEIIHSDCDNGKIVAKTSLGLYTSGEKIGILIHDLNDKIIIKIISYSIYLKSYRKNRQNIRKIMNQLSSCH